jgi:UDP-N-acetylglucosamine--N-acetylmuramyl-(pentapeptide) pyrophosphoryl-undecaprenol N-acetylglucosamine transferase
MKSCRYLIMAGGTGGHIFPAMAVAKELMHRGANVSWLGTALGMESVIVPAENIEFNTIAISGFRGKGWLAKLKAPFLLCRAVVQSAVIIMQEKPSVVIGFGGFVAAPGGIAARLLGKKLIIHEQNSIAGSANRLLAKIAHKNLTAFPNSLVNSIHVGNPVRSSITNIRVDDQLVSKGKLRLLIIGGSLGAKAINDVMPCALGDMDEQCRPEIWHQTGKNKQEPVSKAYQELNISARTDEFIGDMAAAYVWADLLVCRAGALTVSEVAVAGVPAIFIPLPSAIDNHQYYNAKWLVDNNAALLMEQKKCSQEDLSQLLSKLNVNRDELKKMHVQLKKLALPDAANQVANHCEELCYAK